MQLTNLTATQVVAGIAARKFSSEEVAKAFLDRTAKLASLNIYVHLDPEVVLTHGEKGSFNINLLSRPLLVWSLLKKNRHVGTCPTG